MSIKPQTSTNDLMTKLIELEKKPKDISPFVLNSIKQDAQKLRNTNASEADMILGAAAFLKHETQEMLRCFKNAIKLEPNNTLIILNYATYLNNSGRHADSMKYYHKAYEIINDNTDIKLLTDICQSASTVGLFKEAQKYKNLLLKLKQQPPSADFIDVAVKIIGKHKFNDIDLQKYFCAVTDVLTKYDIYPEGILTDVFDDEGFECFVSYIVVDETIDKVIEMNIELAEVVVELDLPTELLMAFSRSFTIKD